MPMRPSSSPITGRMKSVRASGRKNSFWCPRAQSTAEQPAGAESDERLVNLVLGGIREGAAARGDVLDSHRLQPARHHLEALRDLPRHDGGGVGGEEREALHRQAPDEGQRDADGPEEQGRAEVRLEQDEEARESQGHDRRKRAVPPVVEPPPLTGEMRREPEDQRQLRHLAGLEREGAHTEPAVRALDLVREPRHEQGGQEHQGDDEERLRETLERARIDAHRDEHGDHPEPRPDRLALQEVRRVPLEVDDARGPGRAVDDDHTERHQGEGHHDERSRRGFQRAVGTGPEAAVRGIGDRAVGGRGGGCGHGQRTRCRPRATTPQTAVPIQKLITTRDSGQPLNCR